MMKLIGEKREMFWIIQLKKKKFYERVLKEAKIALAHDEIPIGCSCKDGEIIGEDTMRERA